MAYLITSWFELFSHWVLLLQNRYPTERYRGSFTPQTDIEYYRFCQAFHFSSINLCCTKFWWHYKHIICLINATKKRSLHPTSWILLFILGFRFKTHLRIDFCICTSSWCWEVNPKTLNEDESAICWGAELDWEQWFRDLNLSALSPVQHPAPLNAPLVPPGLKKPVWDEGGLCEGRKCTASYLNGYRPGKVSLSP